MSTGISWTDTTWNPTTGCDRVSAGCDRCYALTMAKRLKGMGQAKYQNDGDPRTSGPGFGLTVHPDTLDAPLHWRKPQMVFVNSMSDLFHPKVPTTFIASVFDVMARTPQHTYQVLTKRAPRMRSLSRGAAFGEHWPLPNVWLGVSAENQEQADARIPALLETRASVRFVSAEPLLEPIDIERFLWDGDHDAPSGLSWVIVGGESGRDARPMEPAWVRSIAMQCRDAGVAVFVKQMGAAWARRRDTDSHGADWEAWAPDIRIREFPETHAKASA